MKNRSGKNNGAWLFCIAGMLLMIALAPGFCAQPPDPLLDLLLKKGFITEDEAAKVQVEADKLRAAGTTSTMPPISESKWKISDAIKNVELFGEMGLRYEQREVKTLGGGK